MLEATALDAREPPVMLMDLSEEDFDLPAYMAQEQFGPATVENLNKLLESCWNRWGFNMTKFDDDDITLQHERLADRSGYLRLTHRPSGVFVDAHLDSRPVRKVKDELMAALRRKVVEHDANQLQDTPSPSSTGEMVPHQTIA